MKFSIKDFLNKCDQIRRKLRIWSNLLKKSLMENFIFCAVYSAELDLKNLLALLQKFVFSFYQYGLLIIHNRKRSYIVKEYE